MEAEHPEASVAVGKSTPEQSVCGCSYFCATTGIPLKGLWPKAKPTAEKVHLKASLAVGKSMLQHIHLEASVALHEVMLEHLKACGHG